jgi:hypothetical protein
LREMFHATAQRGQRLFITSHRPVSRITWCRYHFPEIYNSDVKVLEKDAEELSNKKAREKSFGLFYWSKNL